MTRREAAIVTMYTGILIGDFHDAHAYAEELMGRPLQTLEMACDEIGLQIKEKAKPDFMSITIEV